MKTSIRLLLIIAIVFPLLANADWKYREEQDLMDGGKTIFLTTNSSATYLNAGTERQPSLVIRYREGNIEVYFSADSLVDIEIETGELSDMETIEDFIGTGKTKHRMYPYYYTNLRLKFDNGPVIKQVFDVDKKQMSASSKNPRQFLTKMLMHKQLIIEFKPEGISKQQALFSLEGLNTELTKVLKLVGWDLQCDLICNEGYIQELKGISESDETLRFFCEIAKDDCLSGCSKNSTAHWDYRHAKQINLSEGILRITFIVQAPGEETQRALEEVLTKWDFKFKVKGNEIKSIKLPRKLKEPLTEDTWGKEVFNKLSIRVFNEGHFAQILFVAHPRGYTENSTYLVSHLEEIKKSIELLQNAIDEKLK